MNLGVHQTTQFNQTKNTMYVIMGVRLWGISFIVERETAQTVS